VLSNALKSWIRSKLHSDPTCQIIGLLRRWICDCRKSMVPNLLFVNTWEHTKSFWGYVERNSISMADLYVKYD